MQSNISTGHCEERAYMNNLFELFFLALMGIVSVVGLTGIAIALHRHWGRRRPD